jgi:protoporphyrinogen oxidase
MKVSILGGGISGLSAAYFLGKKGFEVEVFEKEDELGGIASSFPFEGTFLDRFYRHVYVCDSDLLGLIGELGLSEKLRWHPSRMGLYYGGKSYDFGGPLDLLKFTPLSLPDRLRFGLITLYLAFVRDSSRFDNVSADAWLKKYMGEQGYNVVWAPLLKCKFGESYRNVPLAWFWSKIQLRKSNRTKTMSNEKLGYLDGSFKELIDSLEKNITALGGVIHKKTAVREILLEDGKTTGIKASNGTYLFDKILSTLPLPGLAGLLPQTQEEYKKRLLRIKHKGILVMVLKLKRQLSPYYWLSISDSGIPFNLLLEHTNFIPPTNYGGKRILYVSNYTATEDPLYRMSADDLFDAYLPHIRKVCPKFNEDDVEEIFVFRNDYGTAVFEQGYRDFIPESKTPIRNLYIACGEQIYPEDRGMSKSIELAKKVCEMIA